MAFTDWIQAAEAPSQIAGQQIQNQQNAFGLALKQQAVNALQSYDVNNPDSLNTAIQGSVRAGALEQASALMGLNLARLKLAAYSDPSAFAGFFPGAGGTQQPQGDQSGPTAQQVATAAQPALQAAQDAVTNIKAASPDQRQAVWNAERQKLLAHNLPTEALDAVGQHLTDNNFSDETLDDLTNHYGQQAATLNQVAQGQTGTLATDHPADNWAVGYLNDPNRQAYAARMGLLFPELTQEINANARTAAAPFLAQQAEAQYAGQIEQAKTGPLAQRQYLTTELTNIANLQTLPAVEAATARAKAIGALAGSIQTVDVNGVKTPFILNYDQNNNPYFIPIGQGGGGPGGQPGPGVHGLSPAEETSQRAQGTQAAELLKPDNASLNAANNTAAAIDRGLAIARTMKFDPSTPWKVDMANLARAIPGIDKLPGFADSVNRYATAGQAFEAIANQALVSGAKASFPQRVTNTDLRLLKTVFPTLSTPNDQAQMALGVQGAQAWRDQQWEQFKANYQGDKSSPQAIEKAWQATPAAQSIYSAPVWQHVMIGGKPAVDPSMARMVNGHKVNLFAPGLFGTKAWFYSP